MAGPLTAERKTPSRRGGLWNYAVEPFVQSLLLLLHTIVFYIIALGICVFFGRSIFVYVLTAIATVMFGCVFIVRRGGSIPRKLLSDPANAHVVRGYMAIVTGANSGIGKETARQLAIWGCHVIVASRDERNGMATVAEIQSGAQVGSSSSNYQALQDLSVEHLKLDLADLDSVKAFAQRILDMKRDVNLLVNNAGVMMPQELMRSKEGHELQFATNHLGHFLLTKLLFNNIANCNGRVVIVGSSAHCATPYLDIAAISEVTEETYNPNVYYCYSKTCNLLFAVELMRRFRAAGSTALAVPLHPGGVKTNLSRHIEGNVTYLGKQFLYLTLKNSWQGAQTSLFLCAEAADKLTPAAYYADAKVQWTQPGAVDPRAAGELWDWSDDLCARASLTKA